MPSSSPSYGLEIHPGTDKAIPVHGCGLALLPNAKLRAARARVHHLNLLLIGSPGVGKSTLMNALFGQLTLMPADRIRQTAGGLDIAQTASYFGSCQEGGVQLSVHLLEALNFAAPAQQLAEDSEYRGRLLTLLKDRQREAFRRERAPGRQAHRTHEGLIHAVLYWVPPTFRQFERAEISFFREISQLSILIPIIGKADLYTEGELKHLKLLVPMALIRAQFEANNLVMVPDLLMGQHDDQKLLEQYQKIQNNWPLAIIASTELDSQKRRVRALPWATIDVDDEEVSDMHSLELFLIASFKVHTERYLRHCLYEAIWRPIFLDETDRNEQLTAAAWIQEKTALDQALARRFGSRSRNGSGGLGNSRSSIDLPRSLTQVHNIESEAPTITITADNELCTQPPTHSTVN